MKTIKILIAAAATMFTLGTASAGGLCTKIHDTGWHGFQIEPKPFTEGQVYSTGTDFYVQNTSAAKVKINVDFTNDDGRRTSRKVTLGPYDWKRFRGVALEIDQAVLPYKSPKCAAFLKNRQTSFMDMTLKIGTPIAVVGAGTAAAVCVASTLGACAAVGVGAGAAGAGAASTAAPAVGGFVASWGPAVAIGAAAL